MRLYNGCPDDELKAVWDDANAVHAEARALGVRLTWFPMEGKWAASTSMESAQPYRELSGFHSHLRSALNEAKERLGAQ